MQRFRESRVLDSDHVIGDFARGVGVRTTAIFCGKIHVAVRLWERFGAHEQHVLEIVSHPLKVHGV